MPQTRKQQVSSTSTIGDLIDEIGLQIQDNDFFIVSIPGCEYCAKATSLLTSRNMHFGVFTLAPDQTHRTEIIEFLDSKTDSYRKFPKVFYKGTFIGGYTKLEELVSSLPEVSDHENVSTMSSWNTPWQSLINILYLNFEHIDNCVPLVAKKMPKRGDIMLQYDVLKEKLNVPSHFLEELRKCLRDEKKRFVTLPLDIVYGVDTLHSHFLVYDKRTGEMERFEPQESIDPVHQQAIDENLKSFFIDDVGETMKISRWYPPMDYCPTQGPRHLLNSGGLCQVWSLWYTNTRLSNPDKTRNQVTTMALGEFKQDSQGFKNFVQSYNAFLHRANKEVLLGRDPASTFIRLLEVQKGT